VQENERIIRLPKVREQVGMGTTAIYGMIKRGEFPKQVKLGRLSGWMESEIQEWIKDKAAKRPSRDTSDTSTNALPA